MTDVMIRPEDVIRAWREAHDRAVRDRVYAVLALARAKRIIGRLWPMRRGQRNLAGFWESYTELATEHSDVCWERDHLREAIGAWKQEEALWKEAEDDWFATEEKLRADLAEARAEVGRVKAIARTALDRATHGPRCGYWRDVDTDGPDVDRICDCGLDDADRELAALEVSDD